MRRELDAGQRNILDVLDTQERLVQARVQAANAKYERYMAAHLLLSAIGQLDAGSHLVSDFKGYVHAAEKKRFRDKSRPKDTGWQKASLSPASMKKQAGRAERGVREPGVKLAALPTKIGPKWVNTDLQKNAGPLGDWSTHVTARKAAPASVVTTPALPVMKPRQVSVVKSALPALKPETVEKVEVIVTKASVGKVAARPIAPPVRKVDEPVLVAKPAAAEPHVAKSPVGKLPVVRSPVVVNAGAAEKDGARRAAREKRPEIDPVAGQLLAINGDRYRRFQRRDDPVVTGSVKPTVSLERATDDRPVKSPVKSPAIEPDVAGFRAFSVHKIPLPMRKNGRRFMALGGTPPVARRGAQKRGEKKQVVEYPDTMNNRFSLWWNRQVDKFVGPAKGPKAVLVPVDDYRRKYKQAK